MSVCVQYHFVFAKILHNLCIRLSIVALSSMAKSYELILIEFKYEPSSLVVVVLRDEHYYYYYYRLL